MDMSFSVLYSIYQENGYEVFWIAKYKKGKAS